MTKNEKDNFQYEIFINSGVMHFIHEFKQRKEKNIMSKKTNQPNMICPCCGGREFITTVTVTQDWRVSFGGDFLEEVSSCNDVLRELDTDNIWSCFRCGGEAVSLNDFDIDHDPNDLVFEVEGPDDFILNWKNIGKFFYLALYASYGEAEEGNLTVGYSVYDKDRKLLDGGDYEYPQEVDTDTVADRFNEVMDFIFWDGMMESEETVKKLKIRVSDLERDDFDD